MPVRAGFYKGGYVRRRLLQRAVVDLQRRIERLEQLGSPASMDRLVWIETVDPEEKNAMSPDDRIVEDFYLNEKADVVMISERITHEVSDLGEHFPDGSWDRSRLPTRITTPTRIRWKTPGRPARLT
jgi:hypothetical protein